MYGLPGLLASGVTTTGARRGLLFNATTLFARSACANSEGAMSCCGGSPVSRIWREAKSLSAPLMRNCVFSAKGTTGGTPISGATVGVIEVVGVLFLGKGS